MWGAGSNFDDGMKKTTGGRNGYGAKLANIFSTSFTIETADSKSGLKYRQTFRKNMTVRYVQPQPSRSSDATPHVCLYSDKRLILVRVTSRTFSGRSPW